MANISAVVSRKPTTTTSANFVDVLDRVLDKGIVIDAWVRVSLIGIDLISVDARVFVASIRTYLEYEDVVAALPRSSPR
jgi:hypothetical protein